MKNLPRVTYSNTGEDFSGVHAHLDAIIPDAEARLLGKSRPAFIGGRDRSEGRVVVARSPIDRDIVLGEFPQAGRGAGRRGRGGGPRRVSRMARSWAGRAASQCSAPARTCSSSANGTSRSPA